MTKLPAKWQGLLWSVDVKNLDPKRDRSYIIHQILVYGSLGDFAKLRELYSEEGIKEVFLTHPAKIYTSSRFNFVKNYVLPLRAEALDERSYVQNTPRVIRS